MQDTSRSLHRDTGAGVPAVRTDNLPNDLLALHAATCSVCLAEEEFELLGVLGAALLIHLFHNIDRVLAQRLPNRVEKHENDIWGVRLDTGMCQGL